jgi:hypothetical protein
MDEANKKYILRFSHKIVEHLGIKLYQNKPTNVIAELVSNAWDADAKNVWIDITAQPQSSVVVVDDGHGMSANTIRDDYLIIGKPKRDKASPHAKTKNGRDLTGRKGIGKLAPFGIAATLHVISIAQVDAHRLVTWIVLSLTELRKHEDPSGESSVYEPEVVCSALPIADLSALELSEERKALVQKLEHRLSNTTGTLIALADLSTKKAISAEAIAESMGRRFTVTLLRPDFKVHINGVTVSEQQAFPNFAFKIGEPTAPIVDHVKFDSSSLEVRYWVGFVGAAQWPQDQAGVGVYAHGKIAQDRPFTFGVKGREIFTRYMYGVVEADWLDEFPEDLVSTDRTSVDWERPEADALRAWGERKVREWTSAYESFKKEKDRQQVIEEVTAKKESRLSPAETEAIADLFSEISPTIGNDVNARTRVINSLTGAWIHTSMRDMTKKLWDSLRLDEQGAQHFVQIVDRLHDYLVPESMSLAVTFAQRAYALSLLFNRIHLGTETDLQKLIETFPWILQPEMEKLTANQTLRTVIKKAEEEGALPVPQIEPTQADALKPDFVFFSPPGEYGEIVVVELKNPGQEHLLTMQNEFQLSTYLRYLKVRYPDAKIRGLLIGNNYSKLAPQDRNVEVLDWSDVLLRSRKGHIELLASMLVGANPDPNDSRVAQVAEYGGKEAMEMLERLAVNDPDLKGLMQQFSK